MAYIGLDATQHERTIGESTNSPLPVGFYHGVITRAEIKDCSAQAKDPNGKYLEVEFDISHPAEFNKKKLWEKFNLINSNQITVKIAKEQLSDLTQALGMATLNESDDLIGKEVAMMLDVTPPRGNFSAGNKVLKYLPIGSTVTDYEKWYEGKKGGNKIPTERKSWGAAPPEAEAVKPKPWGKKTN